MGSGALSSFNLWEPLLIEEARTRDRVIEAIDGALRSSEISIAYPRLDMRIVDDTDPRDGEHVLAGWG